MDRNIQIEIKDRIAHLVGNPKIICGNNDYSVTFAFDDEWAGVDVKTLRVSYNNKYSDHIFEGNTVELPPIIKAVEVYLGVFAGDITSTKVAVRAEPSILCAGGSVADPEPDVYNQIIDLLNSKEPSGGLPGGYYMPSVSDDGVLSWTPSVSDMPNVESVDITGPAGENGYTPQKGIDYFDGKDGEPGQPGRDGIDGKNGVDGRPGKDGAPGQDGVSVTHSWDGTVLTVTSASGTSSADLKGEPGSDGKDGYTPRKGIDYFDGAPGKDGEKGDPGQNGYTPVKGKDYFDGKDGQDGAPGADGAPGVDGKDGVDGADGITPHIGSNGNWFVGDTDTGKPSRGAPGADGQPGQDGQDGQDGVSPTVSVSKSGKVTTVSITDKNGTKTATVNDGADGAAGKDGSNGKDGYTPVKGADYWTAEDKASIVADVLTILDASAAAQAVVDTDNNITLSGDLADGTYILKYENVDGSTTEICTLIISDGTGEPDIPDEPDTPVTPTYTNLIPTALTHTDLTTVFNDIGYMDGKYASSSSPFYGADSTTVCAGVIPAAGGDVFYIKGITLDATANVHCRVGIGQASTANNGINVSKVMPVNSMADYATLEILGEQYYKLTILADYVSTNITGQAYIWLSGIGTGANLIITANEPIE